MWNQPDGAIKHRERVSVTMGIRVEQAAEAEKSRTDVRPIYLFGMDRSSWSAMEPTALAEVSAIGDAALVGLSRTGDRDAFALLVERRADRMLRTARAILRNEAGARRGLKQQILGCTCQGCAISPHQRLPVCASASRPIARGRLGRFERVAHAITPVAASRPCRSGRHSRLSVDERHILLSHHLHGLP